VQPIVVTASDPLTGWATVGLALVAVATLVYGQITAGRDRKDADRRIKDQRDYDDQRARRDRADSDTRLDTERKTANQRLEDERAYMEKVRRRERQQDSATRSLMRIADLLPLMGWVPDLFRGLKVAPQAELDQCARAVEGLRFGGVADLPGLVDVRATEQFRKLVHLVVTVTRGEHYEGEIDESARRDRGRLIALDLWRYATFVRLSLEHLIERGESLDPGPSGLGVSFPMLDRRPDDRVLWSPPNAPQGWHEAISRDPDDPQYRPAK
jgi:hypothetical protein